MVIHFFKLIRWSNLLIIAILMLVIRIFVFQKGLEHYHPIENSFRLQLPDLAFYLLVISIMMIAAGGNIINDIYDQETDEINKPDQKIIGTHLSETIGWVLYMVLTLGGIALGYYLSNLLNDNAFLIFHLLSPALLWIYASSLKKTALLGNIIVALLAAFVPLILITFEYGALLKVYDYEIRFNRLGHPFQFMFDWSFYLAFFAFISTFLREIIKDIEDIEGDEQTNARTLAVILGADKTKRLAQSVTLIFISLVLFAAAKLMMFEDLRLINAIFQIVCIALPLCHLFYALGKAKHKNDFHKLSSEIKLIMLAGFSTCIFYSFFL